MLYIDGINLRFLVKELHEKLKGKKVYTYLPNDKVLVFDENSVNTVESEVMAAR